MCGLVGMAGILNHKDEGVFKRLLIYDTLRGLDSTGVAVYRTDDSVKVAKIASHPFDLFDSGKFKSAVIGSASKVFIGHNRSATTGKVNTINAHPFEFGHIVGAHNGTLDSVTWARLEEELGYKTDVDSAAIFACFEKFGVEDTISMMTEGATPSTGAWALTWIDTSDKTLNFLRNKHRPFWLCYTEDFSRIAWASEYPMLRHASESVGADFKLHRSDKNCSFWETSVDTWYKVPLDQTLGKWTERPNLVYKTGISGRKPEKVANISHPFTTTMGMTTGYTQGTGVKTGSNGVHSSYDNSLYDMILPDNVWDVLAMRGCSWCNKEVEKNTPGITVLLEEFSVLCDECSSHGDSIRVYLNNTDMDNLQELIATTKKKAN